MQTDPSSSHTRFHLPYGCTFAFSIIDDTDVATLENIRPFYDLLSQLKIVTTKTVWPLGCPEGSGNFGSSSTLEDPEYCEYIKILQRRGFEITWHGATMESSDRSRTELGIRRMRDILGVTPRVHANHAYNKENLYWGSGRIDSLILRLLMRRVSGTADDHYGGHVEGSDYFWGDIAIEHIHYVRNLTFAGVDTTSVNPSMPYRDPKRPYGRHWFSASDAENADDFVRLLSKKNLDLLERNQGVCIVATHVGKGFVKNGLVRDDVKDVLHDLAGRKGWFVPVGPLLDAMLLQTGGRELSRREWGRMQWQWALDTLKQKLGLI